MSLCALRGGFLPAQQVALEIDKLLRHRQALLLTFHKCPELGRYLDLSTDDGLNRLQIIFRITVPLAMSGLISVFVYCFMVAWNDYLFASIFLSSASNFTLPVGLNALFSTPDYIWGRMMAASLVTALPVVIMYALSERFIKSGLTAGGVKG